MQGGEKQRPPPCPHDQGFTLLEVLIAFIIAALALGALIQGAGTGLGSTRVAAHTQAALAQARSRLAVLAATPPSPGEQSGTEPGGYTWRTTVRPLAQTAPTPSAPRRIALYALTATVAWTMDGGRRQVTLSTQRLAEAPAPPP